MRATCRQSAARFIGTLRMTGNSSATAKEVALRNRLQATSTHTTMINAAAARSRLMNDIGIRMKLSMSRLSEAKEVVSAYLERLGQIEIGVPCTFDGKSPEPNRFNGS